MTTDRKVRLLVVGTLAIGVVLGLFFARIGERETKTSTSLVFSTQSVGGEAPDEGGSVETEIPCPWEAEIRVGKSVVIGNPLVDKAEPILSLQQGLVSENYIAWGPVTQLDDVWKVSLSRNDIKEVEASMQGSLGYCTYKVDDIDVFVLRQDILFQDLSCEAENTPEFVGFVCN